METVRQTVETLRGTLNEALPPVALRAFAAGVTALLVVVVLMPCYLKLLRRWRVVDQGEKGDSRRLDVLHADKKHTPTMGGILPMAALAASSFLWAESAWPHVTVAVLGSLVAMLIGTWDDVAKLKRSGHGLWPREKLLLLFGLGIGAGLVYRGLGPAQWVHYVPPVLFPLWVSFVVTGTANAVNLTDGLDGLASGCCAFAAVGLSAGAAVIGDARFASALGLPYAEGGSGISVLCAGLAGALVGFLFFNVHPARVFMGDSGSLGFGTALALAAVAVRLELLLVLLGGVFVAEALSVLLQVFSFRLWRKRVFLIAPLHHHFEFKGWPERTVTMRFWLCGAFLSLLGIAVLL